MQWAQNENRSQFLIHIERGKKTFYVYHLIHWVKSSEAPTRLGGCHIEARRDPTQGAASDVIACTSMPCLSFFFFLGFTPTQLDSCRLGFNSRWFGQKWTISVESGHIGRRPKQAEIGLESCWNSWNRLWMSPKHPKSILHQFYSEYLLLLLCFLFCFCVLFCVSCLLLSLFCESRS